MTTDNVKSGWDDNPTQYANGALPPEEHPSINNKLTKAQEVEQLVTKCLQASQDAHEGKFDNDRAQNIAAIFLTAEIRLTFFIGDIELRAKHCKNEIERVEAEKYQQIKVSATGKTTEVALEKSIARDVDVIRAKQECAEAESEAKKWNYLLGVLKDGHIYFRNLGKASNT